MRVLVVDDSAFMRCAVSQMLTSDPDIEVIATARNGKEGVELAEKHRPDVITLDVEMPEMDGLTALRRIMRDCPTQVIMLSSLTTEGSHVALQALKLGAADVLAKDASQVSLSITNLRDELITRVRALGQAAMNRRTRPVKKKPTIETVPTFRPGQFDLVCIGSSTGGPPVLETILTDLPATMSAPIVVAQHMPEIFTRSMAQRLDDQCQLRVIHAENRMPIEQHTIYIAPGGKNIHINRKGLARFEILVNDQPKEAIYRPSVDALLLSASLTTQRRTLAIVLTGIGSDGLEGAKPLHERGGTILAQDEESCVIYGMPKAVTENALIAASLSPQQIAQAVKTLANPAAATPLYRSA